VSTETTHSTLLDQHRFQRETMLAYLRLRVEMQDWHGVRDAATDIEVIEGKLQLLGWKR